MNQNEPILFYRIKEEFGAFSNFARYSIQLKGKKWPTTEHYFQAQKFAGTKYETEIREAPNAAEAARLGRDRKKPLRKDWEAVKDSIMKEALIAKFTQHRKLKDLLLSTGNRKIVEHTENDSYWADGGDGSGKNRLGILLMEVREELRNK